MGNKNPYLNAAAAGYLQAAAASGQHFNPGFYNSLNQHPHNLAHNSFVKNKSTYNNGTVGDRNSTTDPSSSSNHQHKDFYDHAMQQFAAAGVANKETTEQFLHQYGLMGHHNQSSSTTTTMPANGHFDYPSSLAACRYQNNPPTSSQQPASNGNGLSMGHNNNNHDSYANSLHMTGSSLDSLMSATAESNLHHNHHHPAAKSNKEINNKPTTYFNQKMIF
ncbi:hypothetical protein BLA29_007676 [Euroglyphus maynei]|uniref:Uncharacterized protein n=1 Tax=Euroglyphus maynei TaxID=6958 RepID=A0A1Y3BIV0_EURMA|nr:hypothetical protein BLA29_007676 [Euroglyphus maynei]